MIEGAEELTADEKRQALQFDRWVCRAGVKCGVRGNANV